MTEKTGNPFSAWPNRTQQQDMIRRITAEHDASSARVCYQQLATYRARGQRYICMGFPSPRNSSGRAGASFPTTGHVRAVARRGVALTGTPRPPPSMSYRPVAGETALLAHRTDQKRRTTSTSPSIRGLKTVSSFHDKHISSATLGQPLFNLSHI